MAFGKGCSPMVAFLLLALQTSNAVKVIGDGEWSEVVNACVRENNHMTFFDVLSLDACKEICINELGSLCGAMEYNPERFRCQLTFLRSDSTHYTEPCYVDGWLFAERIANIDEKWSDVKDACIKQNNHKTFFDVPTIDACKEICISELGTVCGAMEYSPEQYRCQLTTLNSTSSAYTEPCYVDGWFYSEIEPEDESEPSCDWPNGQIYWPHPSECNMYIQCTPYGPQEMTCAPGTAWSQALHHCDFHTDCGKETPPIPPAPSCPEPFKMRGDECFFIAEGEIVPLNWDDSQQKCLDMGADLAMPHDMVDFVNYIKEVFPDDAMSTSTIWLGATDREVEQEWKWLSGAPVPTVMWNGWPGKQPSGDGNCMEIHYRANTSYLFYMNDWWCKNKGQYACEFDMNNN